jgi:urease accessory protein
MIATYATLVGPPLRALHAQIELAQVNSFMTGFLHPIEGIDHIVAMLTVGVWGAIAGGRALWVWPAAFVSMMLGGFIAAVAGLSLPWTTAAIFSSMIVLTLMVSLAVRAPVWVGAVIVGLFAFFHGHAHGTEVVAASLPMFAAGFALATAGLHVVGIVLGLAAQRSMGLNTVRGMGVVALLGGLVWMGS